MKRSLRRRLDALWQSSGMDAEEVLAAFELLVETGSAPDGAAGAKAAEVWEQSAKFSTGVVMRRFWCELQVTGMSVAEYFAQRPTG